MKISEDTLRTLIKEKIENKVIEEDRESRRAARQKRRSDRRKGRSRDKFEKGDDPSPTEPQSIKKLDDELSDEDAPKNADDPDIYKECLRDMTVVTTLVDQIQARRQGFFAFGKKVKSEKEAKTNRGNLLDLVKGGLESAKTGDYPRASELFCAAATLAENPRGGEKFEPVNIDNRIPELLDKWCKKFGGKRKSSKKTTRDGRKTPGKSGKPSPGIKKVQTQLNKCSDPSPRLSVDGKFGTNTTSAWKNWLNNQKTSIQAQFSNVTGAMINAAQWGPMADATGYEKSYSGMGEFIAKVCFGKGGGDKISHDGSIPSNPNEFQKALNSLGVGESRSGKNGVKINHLENQLKNPALGIPLKAVMSPKEYNKTFDVNDVRDITDLGMLQTQFGSETAYTYDTYTGVNLAYDFKQKYLQIDGAQGEVVYKDIYVGKNSSGLVLLHKSVVSESQKRRKELMMLEKLIRQHAKSV